VAFHSPSDFDTVFDTDTGFGEAGTLSPTVGSDYALAVILDESVNILDEEGNVRERVKVLTCQRSQTNDAVMLRGSTWTRTSDSVVHTIQKLEESDEQIDLYIVTR
jgi:hypothetical protein